MASFNDIVLEHISLNKNTEGRTKFIPSGDQWVRVQLVADLKDAIQVYNNYICCKQEYRRVIRSRKQLHEEDKACN